MLFFNRKKRVREDAKKNAEIQEIRQETVKAIENAHKQTKQLNKVLTKLDEQGGITHMIFLATGGDRRKKQDGRN